MITITRKLEFDAGHRVWGHEGKCSYLHGHRWVVEVEATAPDLDNIGRVIDFSVLKDRLGKWLDNAWDHGFILWTNDEDALQAIMTINGPEKTFRLPYNPTSENLARFLLHSVCPPLFLSTPIRVVSITLYETPNCRAKATVED